ncbi:MAG: TRAP transporter small permease subunit [bacterium]
MLDLIRSVEEKLVRAEGWLLVFLVGLMLTLAVYNVLYRNVLVPIQAKLTIQEHHTVAKTPEPVAERDTKTEPAEESGGFGGGFGAESDDESGFGGDFAKDEAPGDENGGFGGDFAQKADEPADDQAGFGGDFAQKADKPADDQAGFGGDFGDKPSEAAEPAPVDDNGGFGGDFAATEAPAADNGGFGGDFAQNADSDEGFGGAFGDTKPDQPSPTEKPSEPVVYEDPPELSGFAKFVDAFVQAVKLEWIDVLLRHLVLVVGFLGAMLATQRRKHITIDALSKVLPEKFLPWIDAVTAALATVICAFLAVSGADLVSISREYPKELMWWADEWEFQLVFPLGFGLLALHFAIRVLESLAIGFRANEGGQS